MTEYVLPFTAFLVVDGKRLPLVRLDVTYAHNQVAIAYADLATGICSRDSVPVDISKLSQLAQGTPASIIVDATTDVKVQGVTLLKAGVSTIYSGQIDDIGPAGLAVGSYNVRVALTSSIARLASGTLQFSALSPGSVNELAMPLDSNQTTPEGKFGTFQPSGFESNYWNELKRILLDIANNKKLKTGSLAQRYADLFGAAAGNQPAAAALELIRGTLSFRKAWREDDFLSDLAVHHSRWFSGSMKIESFMGRITNLGQLFKFRLCETAVGVAAVPYSPFCATKDVRLKVTPDTLYSANWDTQDTQGCAGVILTRAGVMSTNNEAAPSSIVGHHNRTAHTAFGTVVAAGAPAWLYRKGKTDDLVAGYYPASKEIAKGYAKEMALELGYQGKSMTLTCPFRLDLCCLAPVMVEFPQLPGAGLGTAVYGSIQSVRLVADAESKQATTSVQVGYVRSAKQQEAEFADYQHPVWEGQFLGVRLTDPPFDGVAGGAA